MSKPDGRSRVKQGQIDILEVIYKYRFGSRQLIAEVLSVKAGSGLFEKLEVLIKQGLIDKRQDNRQKLLGQPAAYFLTPKGLRFLAGLDNHSYITEKVIKSSYRDKFLLNSTVIHCLQVFSVVLRLKRHYQELKAYLRRDMSQFSYFPDNPPDVFLSLSFGGNTKRFFLDVIPDSLDRQGVFRRVSAYIDFFDKGGWDETGAELPTLLFVAESVRTERLIRRITSGVINKMEPDEESEIYTTTQKALENMDDEAKIWTTLDEPDDLLSLQEID